MTASEAAARWKVSRRRIGQWCSGGRIPGAKLIQTPAGSYWEIPDEAARPEPQKPHSNKPRH